MSLPPRSPFPLLPWLVPALLACDPALTLPPPDDRPTPGTTPTLGFDPPRPPDAVARSTWLVGSDVPPGPGRALWLFRESLSSYDRGRIARGDLPSTLLDRRVDVHAWRSGEDWVLAPDAVLEAGQTYEVCFEDGETLSTFVVEEPTEEPLLERLWPPPGHVGGAYQLWCDSSLLAVTNEHVALPEYALGLDVDSARESWGLERCLSLRAPVLPPEGREVALPPVIQGVALAPGRLTGVAPNPVPAPDCEAGSLAIFGACLSVEDDRLHVENAAAPMLWHVTAGDRSWTELVSVASTNTFVGLVPRSTTLLELRALDVAGSLSTARLEVATTEARPHVVINEVMANPVGPEPASEWVELYNDGTLAVDLGGWRIEDGSGEGSELPAGALEPGAFALVVPEAYEADPEIDPTAPSEVPLFRVPALGKSGLGNTGELVRLRSPTGHVVSKFPALPKPEEGTSIARLRPETSFRQSSGFAKHAAPGSSPGAHNELEPGE